MADKKKDEGMTPQKFAKMTFAFFFFSLALPIPFGVLLGAKLAGKEVGAEIDLLPFGKGRGGK